MKGSVSARGTRGDRKGCLGRGASLSLLATSLGDEVRNILFLFSRNFKTFKALRKLIGCEDQHKVKRLGKFCLVKLKETKSVYVLGNKIPRTMVIKTSKEKNKKKSNKNRAKKSHIEL